MDVMLNTSQEKQNWYSFWSKLADRIGHYYGMRINNMTN